MSDDHTLKKHALIHEFELMLIFWLVHSEYSINKLSYD